MANALATQILVDGARNAVVKITGVLDTSDVSMVAVVDPADFVPVPTGFILDKVTYAVEQGLAVRLWWDASTDILIHTFTQSEGAKFKKFGGLYNNSGAGKSGKINLDTEGWASMAIYNFTLTLEMIKTGV